MPPISHWRLSNSWYQSSVLGFGASTALAGNSATTVSPSPGASGRVLTTVSAPSVPVPPRQSMPRAPSRPVKAVQRTTGALPSSCRR